MTTTTTQSELEEFFELLEKRFNANNYRHNNQDWVEIKSKIEENKKLLNTLLQMEETGGEPDVVEFPNGTIAFVDCAKESPKGRRSCCYDKKARTERKKYPPESSAQELAAELGISLLTEEEYRFLQTVMELDCKTSSWISTPEKIRSLGGAIFADRRFDTVFVYHNGAESYYKSRGFRGKISL